MRRRSRGAAIAAVALLAVVACSAGTVSPGSRHSADASGLRLSPKCPPPPAKELKPTVDQLNKFGEALNLPAWQAGDIGASARLSDGRLVWLFGDTIRPTLQPQLVANSMLVTSGLCVSQLLDARKGPVIPDVSPTVVRWPMSVAVNREQGHEVIFVLCSRIDRGSGGQFAFTFLGTSAAVFTVKSGQAPQLLKVADITPDSRNEQQINWGAAATVHDGWFYVYGTRLTGQKYDFGRELYVARAVADDPGNRNSWQFWDGRRWRSDVSRAKLILPSQGGVSQTLSVDSVGDGFVAVSKLGGDVANFVYKWTAPHPWGPWTPVKELKAPAGFDTGHYEYAPLAHPEIPLASGQLLVSISRNTNDFQHLIDDPEVGRPEFVQVPW